MDAVNELRKMTRHTPDPESQLKAHIEAGILAAIARDNAIYLSDPRLKPIIDPLFQAIDETSPGEIDAEIPWMHLRGVVEKVWGGLTMLFPEVIDFNRVQEKVEATAEHTTPKEQVKNAKHALRVDRAERNNWKNKPGGKRKPGGLKKQKELMRAIRRKWVAYEKSGKTVPGVVTLIMEVRKDYAKYGITISWSNGRLRNLYSNWNYKKNNFKTKPAHDS